MISKAADADRSTSNSDLPSPNFNLPELALAALHVTVATRLFWKTALRHYSSTSS
jgi:ABC-type uncharacterized transport system permease subunit